jgi:hypothetical protein
MHLSLSANGQTNLAKSEMSPEEFIAKWRGTTRTERSAAQEHFLDLCALLGGHEAGRCGSAWHQVHLRKIDPEGDLDAAVAAAYGWPPDIAENEALEQLLALNLEQAAMPG